MPIGILGSLVVCTMLYILFGHVLTGVAPYTDFTDPVKGQEASVAYAISALYDWLWLAGYTGNRGHPRRFFQCNPCDADGAEPYFLYHEQ